MGEIHPNLCDEGPVPVDVAAAVIERKGRILITQRKLGVHLGGLWEFPGGKKHLDESLEACLARELKEELGIACRVGRRLAVQTHAYPEKRVTLHFFACRILEGEPVALDCAGFKWVRPEELRRYPFPEADRAFLDELSANGLNGFIPLD